MDPLKFRRRTLRRSPAGGGGPPPTPTGFGTVKYWELYGEVSALGAGLSANIIEATVPDGHCAELYAIGFKPRGMAGLHETLDLEIAADGKLQDIKFVAHSYGTQVALPWGDNRNPPLELDVPMRPNNLTVKYNEGQKIQLVVTADAGGIAGTYRARAKVLLYEPADVARVFGASISNFATLVGGVSQALPRRLFADYAIFTGTTTGDAKWYELYSKKIQGYEEVMVSHLGWAMAALSPNFDELRLFDYRLKKEFPEYEPFWKVNPAYNFLPMGGDITDVPIQKLPNIIAEHVWTNTSLIAYIKDTGVAIANPEQGALQLLGTYRRVS